MSRNENGQSPRQLVWLAVCFLVGFGLISAYHEGWELDGGYHFLFARWSWEHPELLVGVWSRPLFTFLYSFPARIGQTESRVFTVLLSLLVAHLTAQLARKMEIANASLVVPLIWLQPAFFIYSVDTMTEMVFALILVLAFRLYFEEREVAALLTLSLTVLARPEGVFIIALWGLFRLISIRTADRPSGASRLLNPYQLTLSTVACLMFGPVVWWVAAWLITRDPIFIINNWPPNWTAAGVDGMAFVSRLYPVRLPEVAGFLLFPLFIIGVRYSFRDKRMVLLSATFLTPFLIHTVFRLFGLFGSAGYPRYLLITSPAIAILTLGGLNWVAAHLQHTSLVFRRGLLGLLFVVSGYANLVYADGHDLVRDTEATEKAIKVAKEFEQTHRISRFVWSDPQACIAADRDPLENLYLTRNRLRDLAELQKSERGTLAYWDTGSGRRWTGLEPADFTGAGFSLIYSEQTVNSGRILDRSWFGYGGPGTQTVYLFYKPF